MQIDKEEKLAQLDRILQGRSLHGSESLKAFLRFVVDKSTENQESQLKEYVIATEVFGRAQDFDSRIDSVVRVQASRLRTKLHEYYMTQGKDDRIIIDLPKGQYTPVYSYSQTRDDHAPNVEARYVPAGDVDSLPAHAGETHTPPNPPSGPLFMGGNGSDLHGAGAAAWYPRSAPVLTRPWRIAAFGFALLSVALTSLVFFYRARLAELSAAAAGKATAEYDATDRREIEPLWGDLLRSTEPVLVVYSNTLFRGTAEGGMRLLKSLDSPGSSLGSPIIPQSEIEQSKQPVIEHYTGIGEVMGAYFLGEFLAKMRHASRVKRSLLLNWEDLKTENIVVLGSPAENFFLRDLPQKQDLLFKPMPDDKGNKSFGILNSKRQPGEAERYFAKQEGPSRSQITEDYAVISLLQGLDGKKRMLILAGITTLGTQAAAEYVTKVDYLRDLVRRINIAPAGEPPRLPANFQILVKVKVNGGVPAQISYLTHHKLDR
jgi:hypothetical protein